MRLLRYFIHNCKNYVLFCILLPIFCTVQFVICIVVKGDSSPVIYDVSYDGPPKIDVEMSKIKDAIPKIEPMHPYGTRDYVLNGRHYTVLKSSKGYAKRGIASWYGTKFHGEETSTQEIYNLYDMTAASPELPLPSYVQVTNLRNGKKVIVRVNDRGPFYSNRILDLSYVAAKKLGFSDIGTAPVKVVAIDPSTWGQNKNHFNTKNNHTITSNKIKVFLQIGAFSKLDNAQIYSKKIKNIMPCDKEKVKIDINNTNMYRVQVGPYNDTSQSYKIKLLLENNGFDKIILFNEPE